MKVREVNITLNLRKEYKGWINTPDSIPGSSFTIMRFSKLRS
jgi:hypothetical protein